MHYIGIDYGTKRVGVAISNDDNTMAFPHSVIENNGQLIEVIEKIAEQHKVKTIVIGESKDLNGKDNPLMEKINELKVLLEARGFMIVFELEFLSSHQAAQIQGEGKMHDASAAAIILSSFLSKQI